MHNTSAHLYSIEYLMKKARKYYYMFAHDRYMLGNLGSICWMVIFVDIMAYGIFEFEFSWKMLVDLW